MLPTFSFYRISKRKDQKPGVVVDASNDDQKEIKEARALWQHLKTLHDKAHQQREKEWHTRHPNKKDFLPSPEENKRDTTFNEWIFDFVQQLQGTPEQRYERERNGHDSKVHGSLEGIRECTDPRCRYYEKIGRIESIEILSRYEGYDRYEEVRRVWEGLLI